MSTCTFENDVYERTKRDMLAPIIPFLGLCGCVARGFSSESVWKIYKMVDQGRDWEKGVAEAPASEVTSNLDSQRWIQIE